VTFAQVLGDQHRAARPLHRRTPGQAPATHTPLPAKPGTCPAATPGIVSPPAGTPAATGTGAGERLLDGRYRLGDLLGRGSEADVYRATDLAARGSAPELAVKIFRAGTADAASPFIRERDLHGPLRHRAIVRVLGHGRAADDAATEAGRGYVITELVDGPDLRSHLHGNTLSARQVTVWSADIAGALAHLHRRGIVHNDVKPANIILGGLTSGVAGTGGRAMLTDFGIATSARHRANSATSGTPHYLSPEAVYGTGTSSASDIYALGLVIFECLTGIKAFPGPALESMVARTLRLPRLPSTVGRRWSVLLHAMTDPEPSRRPTAAAVARALKRIDR